MSNYRNQNINDINVSKAILELKKIDNSVNQPSDTNENTTTRDMDFSEYFKSTHDVKIKVDHGVDINKYHKETLGGCDCSESEIQNSESCVCPPEYEAEVCTCNYKGCNTEIAIYNCNCGTSCACAYFCDDHQNTNEANLLLAKISTNKMKDVSKQLQKRYWFIRHSNKRTKEYHDKIMTIDGYDVYHTSDHIIQLFDDIKIMSSDIKLLSGFKGLIVFDTAIGKIIDFV